MLLSNRQRLLAETGLLTLLGWMALTIAIQDPPAPTRGDIPQLLAPYSQRQAKAPASEQPAAVEEAAATDGATTVTPIVTRLNAIIRENQAGSAERTEPVLPPEGKILRMGTGLVEEKKSEIPRDCVLRDATGKTRHGPMP